MAQQCYTHLSDTDRETLSLGLAQGQSLRTLGRVLGRAPSTVSREHTRNAGQGAYQACTAHTLASARASQPRRPRTLLDPWLWQYVRTHLGQGCSPEQIAGRLRREYPDDMGQQRSPETIYAELTVLPRGALRRAAVGRIASGAQATPTSDAGDGSTGPNSQHDAD